jgi:putative DNA primase/helicase
MAPLELNPASHYRVDLNACPRAVQRSSVVPPASSQLRAPPARAQENFMHYKNSLDAEDIRRRASGRWDVIFHQLCGHCEEISFLLAHPQKRQACPVHGGLHGDAFRLFDDYAITGGVICNTCGPKREGFATLSWLFKWDFPTVLRRVDEVLGGGQCVVEQIRRENNLPSPAKAIIKDDKLIQKNLLETWNATIGLGHPDAAPFRRYCERRGILPLHGPLSDIRFHRNLGYWQFNEKSKKTEHLGDFPAFCAMVRQADGKPVTLHRHYLTHDGLKAPVECPKKQMQVPSVRSLLGSAIRMDAPGEILHLSEGVETGLAVRLILSHLPRTTNTTHCVWSCLTTALLCQVEPVSPTRLVCVWADHDLNGAGRKAAQTCVENLQRMGLRAILVFPTFALRDGDENLDWLDVWNRYGSGIANHSVMASLSTAIDRECQASGHRLRVAA